MNKTQIDPKINKCDTCTHWNTFCTGVKYGRAKFDNKGNVVDCQYYVEKEEK